MRKKVLAEESVKQGINKFQFVEQIKGALLYTVRCMRWARYLPLPLGEVAERSEVGEGKTGCKALSVTFGDSSPDKGILSATDSYC